MPPEQWPDLLVNDLEEAVSKRHPEIGRCREDLLKAGAVASLMSGSGSAVFGLFEDRSAVLARLAKVNVDGVNSVALVL